MNTTTRRLLGGLAIAAVLSLGQGGFVRAADPTTSPTASAGTAPSGPTGAEMLSVQPSLISVSAKPGATGTTTVTLRAAASLDVSIKVQGLAQAADGSFKSVDAGDDASPFSARTMLSVTPEKLSVKSGDTIKLTVSVAAPANVGEGTRYAILTITGLPATAGGSSNVGFGVSLGVSTIVTIEGTAQRKTGEVKGIEIGQALPGAALPVNVSFLNSGNTHYGALPNELVTTGTLQDAAGKQLATATVNGTQLSVIPSFTRLTTLPMSPSSPLVDGSKYHIEVGVGLKDGTVFDRKALDFTWSGGAVLSPTSAPIQTPPASAPATPGTDTMTLIAVSALSAAAVALVLLVLPRLVRRRPRPEGKASDK